MLPISNMLAELNQMVSFPDSLSGLEALLRRSEKEAEQLTHLFINAPDLPVLFLNIFIIAVIPAVAEEFFFRGALQKLFTLFTKNIHAAIIITALLFSVIHFQFFSFTPRFFLGIVFGYLMYYTGNIWVPVIAHFVNNAAAVIVYYMITSNQLSPEAEHIGNSATLAWFAVGFVVSVFAFYAVCRKKKVICKQTTLK
jgi:membrane protease YdiL (CAAX protease family)